MTKKSDVPDRIASPAPAAPAAPLKFRLVPPINFRPNTTTDGSSRSGASISSIPFADLTPSAYPLIPSTDLTLLLSDPATLKRYRAGRYKQGTNTALRIGWTSELSSAVSHIGGKCTPRASTDTLVSLALHMSAMDMIEWTSVQSLASTRDRYAESIPTLSLTTIHLIQSLLTINFRSIGQSRTIIIPHHVDDDLSRLSATTGITKFTLSTLCLSHTISSQPHKYLNKRMVRSFAEVTLEVRHWLRWKAKNLETAIDEFERFDRETDSEGKSEDV